MVDEESVGWIKVLECIEVEGESKSEWENVDSLSLALKADSFKIEAGGGKYGNSLYNNVAALTKPDREAMTLLNDGLTPNQSYRFNVGHYIDRWYNLYSDKFENNQQTMITVYCVFIIFLYIIRHNDNKRMIRSLLIFTSLLMYDCTNAVTFGFRTCERSEDGEAHSPDTFFVYYQWEELFYSCNITSPNSFDTLYTCDTDSLTPQICTTIDYLLQINSILNNPNDIGVSGIVVDGREITVPCKRIGNDAADGPNPELTNDAYQRLYDLGNNAPAIISVSSQINNVRRVPLCPTGMKKTYILAHSLQIHEHQHNNANMMR